jgi:hypothetical protein
MPRARKCLRSLEIDCNELILPAYVAWQAGQPYLTLTVRQAAKAGGIDFLRSIPGLVKHLQIRTQLWK